MIVDVSKQSTNEYKTDSNIKASVPITQEISHVL